MALATWGELQAAVLRTLDAEQDEERKALLPVWRDLAESDIYSSLRTGWMVRSAEAIADSSGMTLPPSLLELQGIGWVNSTLTDADVLEFETTGSIAALANVAELPLQAIGPEQVAQLSRRYTLPAAYLITGHVLRLVPWPGPGPLLTRFTYWSRGDPLEADSDTNEILHHLPSAWMYGILRHAALFAGDTQAEQRWTAALVATVERANASSYGWVGTGITSMRAA